VTTVHVTDEATREQIAVTIAELRKRATRYSLADPKRTELGAEIDPLVTDWMAAGPNCRTCGRTKANCDAEPRACCEVCHANGHGD
jgi:hypothetical protein